MTALVDLVASPQWVAWRTEIRNGVPTKVPYVSATRKAQANRPETWITHDRAVLVRDAIVNGAGGGVGIEFGKCGDYWVMGADLDTCRDPATGEIADWAIEVINRLESYTEVSPSATGVKIFFLVDPADIAELRRAIGDKDGCTFKRTNGGSEHPPGIELYSKGRFFTVTWEGLDDTPSDLRTVPLSDLRWVLEVAGPKLAGKPEKPTSKDGSRSAVAFARGSALRRAGKTFDEMCAALRDDPETAQWCRDKGDANGGRELRRIWEKADTTDPNTLIVWPLAPLDSARELIRRHHTTDALRTLHHQQATFYRWTGSCYTEQPHESVRAVTYSFLDGAQTENKDGDLIPFKPNQKAVAWVMDALSAATQLPTDTKAPSWLDGSQQNVAPFEVLAFTNGLLHLPTRRLRSHTPLFFNLNAVDYPYDPDAPEPTLWLDFLQSIWPGDQPSIDTLQEVFGLLLTTNTAHQKAFLIVGPRRSGKGTIARILTAMLGKANVAGPTLSSLGDRFGIAPLIGKPLAIISDARLSGRTDPALIAERLLSISGEDAVTVDRKNRDAWTGTMPTRFMILTNELPRLSDASGALVSRFIVLRLIESFYGREDIALTNKLLGELTSILNWALTGYDRLRERGYFLQPPSAAEAVRQMEDLGSPISAFIRDRCIVEPGRQVEVNALFDAWLAWCRDQNRDHPGTKENFGKDLRAAVPGLRVTHPRTGEGRVRVYEGIDLQ